ncbi:MAG: hypothetical protein F6K19_22550 [Cyanothece sp. SIO1E1]|nr:hypothetical protein [Cyanothece sp. SIO1E1]
MTVELGGITLNLLTEISVREQTRIVHHGVPGLSGDLAQALGRPSVMVAMQGIFYGETAEADLQRLRDAYLGQEPLDFFTATIGEGYFTQVLITKLDTAQRVNYPDQFDFKCEVVEYVEPPEPVAVAALGNLDADLLGDATAFMDDVQNAVAQVSELTDLIANVPDFGNPTEPLNRILDEYTGTVGGGLSTLEAIRNLF